jgi:hypothetical protein
MANPQWTKTLDFAPQPHGPNGYEFSPIDPKRWSEVWPYQLYICTVKDGHYYKAGCFTLPIPPQELDLDMPFAESALATLGGISEEHSGAPFRNIQLQGTTGVAPFRRSTGVAPTPPSTAKDATSTTPRRIAQRHIVASHPKGMLCRHRLPKMKQRPRR